MEAEYKISSRDYLARARNLLDGGDLEKLFHAAFELRCGIESRMEEYLEVWDHISKKKKKGWRIADIGKNVEAAFKSGDKIIRWAVYHEESGKLMLSLYYTPVTSKLKKDGQKLGNYLHSMKKCKKSTDPYWLRFRSELEKTYMQLKIANTGTLLGPPLMKPGTGSVDMKLEIPPETDTGTMVNSIMKKGKKIKVEVSYLNKLPGKLEEEAHVWQFAS